MSLKKIFIALISIGSSIFHSHLIGMDNFDFDSFGFEIVESSEDSNEDLDSSAAYGCNVPLQGIPPVINCVYDDSKIFIGIDDGETRSISFDGKTFEISKNQISEIRKEARLLGIASEPFLKDDNAEHLGTLIKEICKTKDMLCLSKRIAPQFFQFCEPGFFNACMKACFLNKVCQKNNVPQDINTVMLQIFCRLISESDKNATNNLNQACNSILDNCIIKKQTRAASFETSSGRFEAFVDKDKSQLAVRNTEEIAHGAFKRVFPVIVICLKEVSGHQKRYIGDHVSIQSRESIDSENNILLEFDSPYIITPSEKFLNTTILDSKQNACYEYLAPRASGELGIIIFKAPTPKHALILKYALQAARGLSYLHNVKGYVHRDIKHENIFIVNGIAKLADFGSCIKQELFAQSYLNGCVNGVSHPSPEASICNEHGTVENGFPMDMWAFRVCLFQLSSPGHQKPYFLLQDFGGCSKINIEEHAHKLFEGWVANSREEQVLQNLILNLLKFEKHNRYTATQTVLFLESVDSSAEKSMGSSEL